MRRTPAICPVCGEPVPPRAAACPGCGACERSGWTDDSDDGDGFDYQAFVDEEFGGDGSARRGVSAQQWFWRLAGLAVLIAFLILLVRPWL